MIIICQRTHEENNMDSSLIWISLEDLFSSDVNNLSLWLFTEEDKSLNVLEFSYFDLLDSYEKPNEKISCVDYLINVVEYMKKGELWDRSLNDEARRQPNEAVEP